MIKLVGMSLCAIAVAVAAITFSKIATIIAAAWGITGIVLFFVYVKKRKDITRWPTLNQAAVCLIFAFSGPFGVMALKSRGREP